MKPIEELLKNLGRAEVLEFGLVTNRLPSVNIGGKFEPVDDEAPTTDVLLQMLVTMGGSRYVEQLSERPVQWTTRLDGVGVIAVAAIMRKDVVQARFTVARRDSTASRASVPPAGASGAPGAAKKEDAAPAPDFRRTSLGTGGPQPNQPPGAGASKPSPDAAAAKAPGPSAQSTPAQKAAPQAQPSSVATKAAAAVVPAPAPSPAPSPPPVAATPGAGPLAGAVPPPDDWDDDDEPTVQTLSPPVAPPRDQGRDQARDQAAAQQQAAQGAQGPQGAPGEDPKPKPARKPGEVPAAGPAQASSPASDERKIAEERRIVEERAAADRKAAEERKIAEERAAAERKAAEDRAAAERKAAEDRKASEDRAAAERKALEERKLAEERKALEERKLAEERKALEERKLAEERKVAEERKETERKAQERVAAERAASDKRAAIERAAAERAAAAAERAAAERKAAERAKVERRISTPTSVDAVDVEITTSDSGTRQVAGGADAEPVDNTVEVTLQQTLQQQIDARPAAGAVASHGVPSAIPSTTPSAAGTPEQDRPRVDGALESFLAMGAAARASDIHIVAGRPALLRVATDLIPRTQPVAPDQVERIAREIVPARLRETLEVDGSCDFAIEHPKFGRFRVNVSKQRTGYKVSMRVVPHDVPTLASLALPEAVGSATKYSQGLVLVTGPVSQGKTSTLAAIVDLINTNTPQHVLTIEDPVEFMHPRKRALISHREVGNHARTTAEALKAAQREDPDVIVIGELRDPETVRLAIEASETGHLVIATMNTASAAKTVDRLIDLFPVVEQPQVRASIAGALRLIIGQRLVPSADRTRLHAAIEMLPSSIALYTLIRDARTFQIPSLQQRGRALGVVRLDESLADLVRTQKVTLEVAKQFAESPQELEAHATRSVPSGAIRKA